MWNYHHFFKSFFFDNDATFENKNNVVIVIARYNEDLNWLATEPFSKYKYIVYNKGVNDNFFRSANCVGVVELPNVGRETHSYFQYIIDHYDALSNISIFLPGSADSENKLSRAKTVILDTEKYPNQNAFACINTTKPSFNELKDFQIEEYLSTNENNKSLNTDASIKLAEKRPYAYWYYHTFGPVNLDTHCVTYNAMFAITKETILQKPIEYYKRLQEQISSHHNHEEVHYFERAWETVFYPPLPE